MKNLVVNNVGGDIEVIEVLSEELKHREPSVGGHYFKTKARVTFFNGIQEEIAIFESVDVACQELKQVSFKELLFDSLGRFSEDSELEGIKDEDNYWLQIINKLENNIALTDAEIDDLNLCFRICTIFEEFDYKTFIR